MPHSRHVDPDGIVITRFTGSVTLDELIEIQNELVNYARDGEIYELVIHPDDILLIQNPDESVISADNVLKITKKLKKGAIAFVADNDFIYGVCRQLQMRVENEYFQLSVFRTEETALRWLNEIKTLNTDSSDD